jgi:dTDP-4-amino-4,6-dideoxygalactose transaminase
MTQVPAFDLRRQTEALKPELMAALEETLSSCAYALGPQVAAFEESFAKYCGVEHAVAVNSGTSALHLALLACDVGPGDEVITTPWTFIATAWAISYVGATPVFVDVDEETLCLDPALVAAKITPKTKAIIPVHIYGQMADMDPLLALAEEHGLAVIEDAAQSHGAEYKGRRAGSVGRLGCFSFYPTKNLGACGEGGAVTTRDPALAKRVSDLRNHAQPSRGVHTEVGYNYRMEGFQGAVLNVKFPHLPAWTERRRTIAATYRAALEGVPDLRPPTEAADRHHVFHQLTYRHPRRDEVRAALQERGIGTGIHYMTPVHRQPAYAHLGYGEGSLPVAEQAAREVVCLPCFPELTDEELQAVVAALKEVC